MRCKCKMMYAGGDMAPRLWECETHGKSGMWGTLMIIEKYAQEQGITVDDSWDIAYNLLKTKEAKKKSQNSIYYCEDYFNGDLRDFFFNKKPKPLVEKPGSTWKELRYFFFALTYYMITGLGFAKDKAEKQEFIDRFNKDE